MKLNMSRPLKAAATRASWVGLTLSLMASKALAQDLTPVQSTLDQMVQLFTGTLGTSLAILAVISCGVLAWVGRLTWNLAGSIILGIVFVFGSANIVEFFKGAAGG